VSGRAWQVKINGYGFIVRPAGCIHPNGNFPRNGFRHRCRGAVICSVERRCRSVQRAVDFQRQVRTLHISTNSYWAPSNTGFSEEMPVLKLATSFNDLGPDVDLERHLDRSARGCQC